MALILQKAWQCYIFVFDEAVDNRTKTWLFVGKPFQTLTLLGLYLMVVQKWGPKWMKHRKPFNIDKLLIVYNALQVLACLFLFIAGLTTAWATKYKLICEPVDTSNILHAKLVYFYFMLKIVDLLDTVFFILRKKWSQITFLHIYHHTGMVLLSWGSVTYLPGGHASMIGQINAFVHIVMYSYYLLTVAVPDIKNKIWIKKLVTQLQILQFFGCVVHTSFLVFKTDCAYPRWTAAILLPQNLFILALFLDFYVKTYIMKPKEKLQAKLTNGSTYSNGHKENEKIETKLLNHINKKDKTKAK